MKKRTFGDNDLNLDLTPKPQSLWGWTNSLNVLEYTLASKNYAKLLVDNLVFAYYNKGNADSELISFVVFKSTENIYKIELLTDKDSYNYLEGTASYLNSIVLDELKLYNLEKTIIESYCKIIKD